MVRTKGGENDSPPFLFSYRINGAKPATPKAGSGCKYPPAKAGALRCWPLKGAGKARDPSPDLVPRPPSPLGEGRSLLSAPPRASMISLSLGERGDRKAEGAPRSAGGGGEGSFPIARHASRNLLPELSNFYCLPGRAGGSPNGLAEQVVENYQSRNQQTGENPRIRDAGKSRLGDDGHGMFPGESLELLGGRRRSQ